MDRSPIVDGSIGSDLAGRVARDRALSEFLDVHEAPSADARAAWIAKDPVTDRRVMIRRVPGSSGKTRATQALGLAHPHIVTTRRWFLDSGSLYVVRDYIEGQNLRGHASTRTPPNFDRLRRTLDPIVDALEYGHQGGVVHGAVLPENVIIDPAGVPRLSDFGVFEPRNGARARYVARQLLNSDGKPTQRSDYFSVYELYKEFLPTRDDEAGMEARTRILRNLSEAQLSTATIDELRYKLDAITRMADLLGFGDVPADATEAHTLGPRLVCQLSPATAVVAPGSGGSVVLTIWNEGDKPLRIEKVTSDVVWLNPQSRFEPLVLEPDDEFDLVLTVSAARLQAGTYSTKITLHSNNGMATITPPAGTPWSEEEVSLPVLVQSATQTAALNGADRQAQDGAGVKPALPGSSAEKPVVQDSPEKSGIACIQDPDPGVIQKGTKGVLHVGIRNIGQRKLRIDRVSASPAWLSYPGEFQPVWIEPDATQYLGLSVAANTLTLGDYKAQMTLVTSVQEETELGHRTVWREMKCEVRVRVTKGGVPSNNGGGCAIPVILGVILTIGGVAAAIHH